MTITTTTTNVNIFSTPRLIEIVHRVNIVQPSLYNQICDSKVLDKVERIELTPRIAARDISETEDDCITKF